jgi:cytochrome c nitrite reductase small subunit
MKQQNHNVVAVPKSPRGIQIIICVSIGIAIGSAFVVAKIANATSYLSEAPETCINCHVMTDAYASWQRGSHGKVAVCTDCHLPHNNIVSKTAFKGRDGMIHSYVFTMRKEPQVLTLSEKAVPVVQANCLRCHQQQYLMVRLADSTERKCWSCHTNFHGKVRSLSSSPDTLRPKIPNAGFKSIMKGKTDGQ